MTRFVAHLLALFLALPVLADSHGLRRLTDENDLIGWEAVGRLDMPGGFCTGTLIATDIVLTAAHCAFDRGTGEHWAPGSVTFRAGYRDGVSVADRKVAQIVTPEGYRPDAPHSLERVRNDVALMRLEEPVPLSLADPFVLYSGISAGAEVGVASYGQGRAEAISRQKRCSVLERTKGIIVFDCNVTFGSSGSAILAREGSRGRIMSLVSAGTIYKGRKVGLGMELPAVVAGLKRQLRAAAPRPEASIRRLQVGGARTSGGAKFVRPGGS